MSFTFTEAVISEIKNLKIAQTNTLEFKVNLSFSRKKNDCSIRKFPVTYFPSLHNKVANMAQSVPQFMRCYLRTTG
jgi:hypothetical protein